MANHKEKKSHRHTSTPRRKTIRPEEITHYENRIRATLTQSHKRRMGSSELSQKCRSRRNPAAYQAAIEKLLREGRIVERRAGFALADRTGCFSAETVRLNRSFGFIRDEQGEEYFVPGKFLMGSMPGDKVLAKPIPSTHENGKDAQVVSILEENPECRLSGTIVSTDESGLCLLPDTVIALPLHIDYKGSVPYRIGDKVLAELTSRGTRHMEHKVRIVLNFGSSDSAENCMAARIMAEGIPVEFSPEILREAEKAAAVGVTPFDLQGREDLREEVIFTIDGASSKDLDDAVSIRKAEDGWELSVHIADVSHYVRPNSRLDAEAFERGTSIYYADKVIPMLPKALSNGICSLNEGEDRLAFSAMMKISAQGDLLDFRFAKTVIRSCVRGVYSECNAVLDGSADAALLAKYAPVRDALGELDRLAAVLEKRREERGAPELESTETALLLDNEGKCVGLAARERGRSECIIEACMLAANEAAARLAREAEIPLVYRVHESPSLERMDTLRETLSRLNQAVPQYAEIQPRDIRRILENARGEVFFPVLNLLTLRAMAKAKYSEEPLGHFGLALRDYCHFTSPIRRYPDLVVHRILSDYLEDAGKDWLQRRYRKFTVNAAARSSECEVRAIKLERDADDCYAAEFMRAHIGEHFHGIITSVTDFGVYVTLDNLAEGLLHIRDLPEGEYEIEEGWYIKDTRSGTEYRLGAEIEVICAKADVSSGNIDLALT